jgi:hypothetical protein
LTFVKADRKLICIVPYFALATNGAIPEPVQAPSETSVVVWKIWSEATVPFAKPTVIPGSAQAVLPLAPAGDRS